MGNPGVEQGIAMDPLADAKGRYLDRLWRGLGLIALLSLPVSLMRMVEMPLPSLLWLHVGAVAVALLVNLVLRRLSSRLKLALLVGVLWVTALVGLLTLGLMAASIWYLAIVTLAIGTVISLRAGMLAAVLAVLALALIGWGFASGGLVVAVESANYVGLPTAWLNLIVNFGLALVLLLLTLDYHRSSLLRLLDEVRRQRDEIEHLASRDPLTGLTAPRLFAERAARALAPLQPAAPRLALLFVDLDGFKAINDRHGHAAGDQVLREVAARFAAVLRNPDTVTRIGGDEFVLLLHEVDAAEVAASVAARLVAALRPPIRHAGLELSVAASIGIALHPDHGSSYEGLLEAADLAMYAAKAAGKGRWCFAGRPPDL